MRLLSFYHWASISSLQGQLWSSWLWGHTHVAPSSLTFLLQLKTRSHYTRKNTLGKPGCHVTQSSTYLCFLRAEIKGVCHNAWPDFFFFYLTNFCSSFSSSWKHGCLRKSFMLPGLSLATHTGLGMNWILIVVLYKPHHSSSDNVYFPPVDSNLYGDSYYNYLIYCRILCT